ncbi:MAG: 30S ribosomal protein S12 methylthiotransferase RimO [Planctomycetes bacterium]|nr:30S ribosomal protein S12 methylthiotransferase RimO [Planctomycetota bacterium]
MPKRPKNASQNVSLVHLGCARNLIDSELILGRMAEEGLVIAGDPSDASTVVLNTCSFIGPAREESESAIRDLIARKRKGEIERVVVAGCLVQRYKEGLAAQFPEVDLFAEISDYRALARSVKALSAGEAGVPRYLAGPLEREPERDGARLLSTPRSYAYLRISHGCDHACSFCAIPSIRGKHRSKPLEAVVSEARELGEAGVRELVLVAEDSTAWGREHGADLPDLVEALAKLPEEPRIRVMYAYPNRFPWRLTQLMREHENVLPYLDIPVQHIATPMLRAMRRAGEGDQVRRTLSRLREEVPGITLRTTLLMGFPGETDADAAEAVEFVREFRLGRLGAFTYSPEQGTPAYESASRVPADVAEQRRLAVLAARDEVLAAEQSAWIGKELEILVDESHPNSKSIVGRPAMDAPEVDLVALVRGSRAQPGAIIRAEVESLDAESNLVCRETRKR